MVNKHLHNVDTLLNDREATAYLNLSGGTLRVWRSQKRYKLPYSKIGSRVMYRLSDLNAFIESRKIFLSE